MADRLQAIGLILGILFLLVVGANLFMGQNFQPYSKVDLDEPPEEISSAMRAYRSKKPELRMRQWSFGSSMAEQRYKAALDNSEKDKEISRERRRSRDTIRDFLHTQPGQYLKEGMDYLQSGDRDQAQVYIRRALESHQQLDFEIYVIFLKTLLHSYVKEEDKEEIDKAVLKYLELIKTRYDDNEFLKVVDQLVDVMQEKMNQ